MKDSPLSKLELAALELMKAILPLHKQRLRPRKPDDRAEMRLVAIQAVDAARALFVSSADRQKPDA